jgi:hypothetical protein
MKTYYICTDAESGEVKANSLNDALREFFASSGFPIKDRRSLRMIMGRYAPDGGFCVVHVDGDRVLQVGFIG